MVPYKGKKAGSLQQYLPNKPKKWGFKIFVRAGVSGFVYDFMVYTGKSTFNGATPDKAFGLGGRQNHQKPLQLHCLFWQLFHIPEIDNSSKGVYGPQQFGYHSKELLDGLYIGRRSRPLTQRKRQLWLMPGFSIVVMQPHWVRNISVWRTLGWMLPKDSSTLKTRKWVAPPKEMKTTHHQDESTISPQACGWYEIWWDWPLPYPVSETQTQDVPGWTDHRVSEVQSEALYCHRPKTTQLFRQRPLRIGYFKCRSSIGEMFA